MGRIKVSIPQDFSFQTTIAVRITDLNYGGHVGNDTILSLIHEARVRYLRSLGFTELEFGGTSLIMSDAAIEFRSEAFYGEELLFSVVADDFSRAGFDICYRVEKMIGDKSVVVALAKTGMVCYNYDEKKISAVPEEVKTKMLQK
ncbi:acyl-CoA thioesterase [Flavihumibacter solisilvae]|uniref:Thioesterase n=1 Tax=Flavihumibacter solisilvae TaxID=1349421 RepID=A0A0C1L0B9_9BACT|nr:thioesterase family protein [Flavihumibacter solisilvae]KIC92986.1 hypothetical protein OI18_19745 [Flavihumibacter solisilvae]